mgnify:CR=1 FL=1
MDWSPLKNLVETHKNWILLSHAKPDGDAIGSLLGLAKAIRSKGGHATPLLEGGLPTRYRFLDPDGILVRREQATEDLWAKADAIAVVDTGTWNQLGHWAENVRAFAGPKVVIDHHATQDNFASHPFISTAAEANCRLIHEAANALGYEPDPVAAQALYTGLATDTGWFRHGNTLPESFTLAGNLVQKGANPTLIYREIYERSSMGKLRLSGRLLSRVASYLDGRVAGSEILLDDWAELGAIPEDAEDLIDLVRVLNGTTAAFVLVERKPGETRGSLRGQNGFDVAEIAQTFGGGGHKAAAGFTHHGPADEAKSLLLERLEKRFAAKP